MAQKRAVKAYIAKILGESMYREALKREFLSGISYSKSFQEADVVELGCTANQGHFRFYYVVKDRLFSLFAQRKFRLRSTPFRKDPD